MRVGPKRRQSTKELMLSNCIGDSRLLGFPHSSVGRESACNARDPGSIPGSGRSPGEGIGYLFQYSDLEKNSMDCIVHGVAKSWTQLRLSLTQTLESPLDSKEIKSVNPEGNQP